MATVGSNVLTLTDHAKRLDPNGKIDRIVEILAERNEILEDMMWMEGNLPTGHRTTVRSGLPSTTWRLLNYGVQPSKSTTKQVDDTVGMLETFAEVDADLAALNGNTSEFRLSEDKAHLEAMSQELASTLIYGNTATDPEKFMGLAPRYSSTSAENGGQIISAGGSGADNTSVWLVTWGDRTCHGIFPKGSSAGIVGEDLGRQVVEDAANGKYMAYQSRYQIKAGLTLRDWRYACRIANIDVSDLTKDAATGADLIDLMIQAIHQNWDVNGGKSVFYCNQTVLSYLDRQTLNQSNINISYNDNPHGKRVMTFRGIPVKRVDAILENEAVVS
jgi:hypothetical protein